jgi:WD40 repeat protein
VVGTTVDLYELQTKTKICTLDIDAMKTTSAAFSPDGRFVLLGKNQRYSEQVSGHPPRQLWEATLRLFDVATGQSIRPFDEQIKSVSSVVFTPDGRLAISSDGLFSDHGCSVKLWDPATGQLRSAFVPSYGSQGYITSLAVSPDGRFVASGKWEGIEIWDLSTGQCLHEGEDEDMRIEALTFSHDGRHVLSGGNVVGTNCDDRGRLQLWDIAAITHRSFICPYRYSSVTSAVEALEKERLHQEILSRAWSEYKSVRISEALQSLKEARSIQGFEKSPASLELQALVGARARIHSYGGAWFKASLDGAPDRIETVAFSPCRPMALSGGRDKAIHLWDLNTRRCVRVLEGHTAIISSAVFSPGGRFVISAAERSLRLWDVDSGECLRVFKGHTHSVTTVTFSPDGNYVFSGCCYGTDDRLRLWEVATGNCLKRFEGNRGGVNAVAYSPEGRLLLSAGGEHWTKDNTLRVWDVRTGKCLQACVGHKERVNCVAFSPDGRMALTGSGNENTLHGGDDTTLRLWDLTDGCCLQVFHGHTDCVRSVRFSPDGRFAISAGGDALRLWDVQTAECLHVFLRGATCMDMSPDGRFLISGNWDKTLSLWELDWEYEYDPKDDPVLNWQAEEQGRQALRNRRGGV